MQSAGHVSSPQMEAACSSWSPRTSVEPRDPELTCRGAAEVTSRIRRTGLKRPEFRLTAPDAGFVYAL